MPLTLDRVIRHTVMHHSSTSTCIPNFIGIRKTFFVDGRMYGRTDIWPMLLGVDLKNDDTDREATEPWCLELNDQMQRAHLVYQSDWHHHLVYQPDWHLPHRPLQGPSSDPQCPDQVPRHEAHLRPPPAWQKHVHYCTKSAHYISTSIKTLNIKETPLVGSHFEIWNHSRKNER